jgi:predicted thioesterase
MQTHPPIGTRHERTFLVTRDRTVSFDGLPPILATPCLIWELETTAHDLLAQTLPEGHLSVGTHVHIHHLAPCPLGVHVHCLARVVDVQGGVVTFTVEARDDTEVLTRGLHQRTVVEAARLARRIERKRPTE